MKQDDFDQAIKGLPIEKAAFFPSIGSTNDVLAEWARDGGKGFCLAAADEQTQGRGRSGRRWFTPTGSALAFSLLLDLAPSFDQALLGRASGLGALAVCEGLEKLYGLQPEIKWPNDVLLNGKKVSGILPEAHWSGAQLQALILGVGVNVAAAAVPPANALNFPATSIEEVLDKKVNPGELLRSILESLITLKPQIGSQSFIQSWQTKLAYMDQAVQLETADRLSTQAQVQGLAEDGSLKMRLPNGELRTFQAGEIQLRPFVDSQLK